MHEMSDEERRAFHLEGTRTGKLAVTRLDGSPYVLPVWFLLDGDDVIFTTHGDTVRGRALRRDGRASMLVDAERPPYSFVRIDGRAQISEDLTEIGAGRARSGRGTWARTSPTGTGSATRSPASSSCAWSPTGSSPRPASPTDGPWDRS